ncbi:MULTISPECIES: exodeoxyribonuclease VII small subunit [unclassified Lactobacillus]|uniref:exodeoxyribonuclease VII small subunit n=1 Tax=unclassified Lactobacillus TaxID=2620435 RepID=UPI000EFCDBD8|nr:MULTISPECIES: exodeoxyribonuclease VII small subunit [unclassified Lactobacillus]RMC39535.1 exodeoxyribonuclease VII small subunit [Lactobacillus sp. ESL0237]RMC43599.1 exodeoxyribonuclease VII small subunit [Lactobacillus sp. ESL0234]RMC45081.1 exodeoxyribonuclease VII small subunit [Lactobacillus sp. ESL0236]RMC46681.1 exodeoxyribonuclease VII small subunit [Lactobacillus sp. ESL0230]RMC49372.1 exodeoxyribonuclease VII small subunit [Lactobacillus sp. ESL0225]
MVTKKNNFEEELAKLQQIVANLENGNVALEDALNEFQTGVKLSRDLNQKLTAAEQTVAKLIESDGSEHKIDPNSSAAPEE